MTNQEIASELERWADARDRCSARPGRTGKALNSEILRIAAARLLNAAPEVELGALAPGERFRFDGHSKVFMAVAHVEGFTKVIRSDPAGNPALFNSYMTVIPVPE